MSATWNDSNHTWDDPEVLWAGLVLSEPPDLGDPDVEIPPDPSPAPVATPGGGSSVPMGKFHNPHRLHVRRR